MVRLIDDLLDVSRISRNKMELRRARVLAGRRGEQRGGDGPPGDRGGGARADRLAAAGAGLPRRRPDPAGPGVRQPAHQQRQVHRAGRADLADRRAGRRRRGRCRCATPGSASRRTSLPSIFDMFCQVDRTIERSTGGLGIGLALVKGLVEMHGGTVDGRERRARARAARSPSRCRSLADRPSPPDAPADGPAAGRAGPAAHPGGGRQPRRGGVDGR